jgi:DNA-binding transcriptional LysR family regulator
LWSSRATGLATASAWCTCSTTLFRAVLLRGHRLAAKRVLDLTDLADEPWVANEWPAGLCVEIMLEACAAAGFSPRFVVESEDYAAAQGFVAAGLGVTPYPADRTEEPPSRRPLAQGPQPRACQADLRGGAGSITGPARAARVAPRAPGRGRAVAEADDYLGRYSPSSRTS